MRQVLKSSSDNDVERASDAITPMVGAGVAIFVLCAIFLVVPRSTPVLLPLLAILLFFMAQPAEKWGHITIKRTPLLTTFVLAGIYLLINSVWSVVPATAYGKVALYSLNVALVWLGLTALGRADKAMTDRLAFNVVLAAGLFGLYLAIEILFGTPIERTLFSYIPALQPSLKHISIADGWVTTLGSYMLNRNLAVLCLLLWPALLIIRALAKRQMSLMLALGLLAVTIIAVAFSQHETSMMSLAAALIIFALASFLPRLAIWLTGAGWLIATLLVVPIALVAFNQQLHFSNALPSTAKARIIIWNYTATEVLKRPLLGVGVQSTKPLDAARRGKAQRPEGFAYPLRTGRHSHNVYMQTWYELGAIGALLLCAIGLALIASIASLESLILPYALATFVTMATIAASSWGLWQPWFMAAFAMIALIFGLASASARLAGLTMIEGEHEEAGND